MKPAHPRILTLNGGSSSIKFALFERGGHDALAAVGHRVVHGGPAYSQPALVTSEMVEALHQIRGERRRDEASD